MALLRRHLPLLALLLAAPLALAAQQVRGRVTSEPADEPVRGAVVVLVDSGGRAIGGALTDDDGRFLLRPDRPGRFSLRVDLVGYRSVAVPAFTLAAGDSIERAIRIALQRVRLPAVTVTADAACGAPDSTNALAASLWHQARTALEATRLAQDQRAFEVTLRRYSRDVMGRDSLVRAEHETRASGQTSNPYASLGADSLARVGYRLPSGDSLVFYAPDARVLLADAFVASHCFRPIRSRAAIGADRRPHVGLAFRPERLSPRVDVEGTLWLDSATAELRFLEYRYTSLPASVDRSGDGLVEFARGPGGVWMVKRWRIRLPIATVRSRRQITGRVRTDTIVLGVHESGGEVLSALPRGSVLPASSVSTRLAGVVFDSTTLAPLPGAIVAIDGIQSRVRTDAAGHFAFDSLLGDGRYVVTASHPRADSLGATIVPRTAVLPRGGRADVTLAIPPLRTLAPAACPARAGESGSAMPRSLLTGRVYDDAGHLPLAGISVSALWLEGEAVDARHRSLATGTDETGRYALCDVPRDGRVSLLLHRAGRIAAVELLADSARPRPAALARDFVVARDLSGEPIDLRERTGERIVTLTRDVESASAIDAHPDSGRRAMREAAELEGIVIGPAGELVSGARVELLARGVVLGRDSTGRFRFRGRIPGPYRTLRVRAVGYAELEVPLTLVAGERRFVLVPLEPAVARLETTRIRGSRPADALRGFEERRRGGFGVFLDRAAIERRGATRVTDVLRGLPGVSIRPSATHAFENEIHMGRSAIARPDCNTGALPGARPDTSRRAPTERAAPTACPTDDAFGVTERAQSCRVRFVLDGIATETGAGGVDALVRPDEIEAIEVYSGASRIPPELAAGDARCGVIAIWTRARVRP